MKQNYFLLLLFCSHLLFSQIINFPDANFKTRLLQSSSTNYIAADLAGNATKIDQNNDGEIDVSEAKNISVISINQNAGLIDFGNNINYNITSLEGINYFTNLKILECKNNNLEKVDFKNLINLEEFYFQKNKITQFLNFEDISKLLVMSCEGNLLTDLDLSKAARNIGNNYFVYYHFNNNPLINLNLQCGKKTIWVILADWEQCPFYGFLGLNSTCQHRPQSIPTLVNLIVNCNEVNDYRSVFGASVNITDDCLIATEETSKVKLSISPNPAKAFLKLDVKEKIEKIDIYDESGRLILSPSVNQNRINISTLKSGIYYLNVLINGKYLNKKFVKL
ncbi:T9SS type A sorting domain-containing protein [Epilithonimonas sp. UC225_85]|uniref:T9SS type A sorting domain-containing protein n=1 Tax=Epilithonimonas sp. UC225_85 TaxID=3350167 RepID=UPI0036D431C6